MPRLGHLFNVKSLCAKSELITVNIWPMPCSSCDPDLHLQVTTGIQGPDMCQCVINTILLFFLGLDKPSLLPRSIQAQQCPAQQCPKQISVEKSAVHFTGLGLSACWVRVALQEEHRRTTLNRAIFMLTEQNTYNVKWAA